MRTVIYSEDENCSKSCKIGVKMKVTVKLHRQMRRIKISKKKLLLTLQVTLLVEIRNMFIEVRITLSFLPFFL